MNLHVPIQFQYFGKISFKDGNFNKNYRFFKLKCTNSLFLDILKKFFVTQEFLSPLNIRMGGSHYDDMIVSQLNATSFGSMCGKIYQN